MVERNQEDMASQGGGTTGAAQGTYSLAPRERIRAALKRAIHEEPLLAAPDGSVAVKISDLQAVMDDLK